MLVLLSTSTKYNGLSLGVVKDANNNHRSSLTLYYLFTIVNIDDYWKILKSYRWILYKSHDSEC